MDVLMQEAVETLTEEEGSSIVKVTSKCLYTYNTPLTP